MTETPKPEQPTEKTFDEAADEAVEMSGEAYKDRLAAEDTMRRKTSEAAHTIMEATEAPRKARRTVVGGAVAVATAVGIGGGFVLAADAQATHQQEQSEQMQQEQEQIDRQLKFENGLESGSVTIEIPSPEQK